MYGESDIWNASIQCKTLHAFKQNGSAKTEVSQDMGLDISSNLSVGFNDIFLELLLILQHKNRMHE